MFSSKNLDSYESKKNLIFENRILSFIEFEFVSPKHVTKLITTQTRTPQDSYFRNHFTITFFFVCGLAENNNTGISWKHLQVKHCFSKVSILIYRLHT